MSLLEQDYSAQELMNQEFRTGQWSTALTFKSKMKVALEQGLLLFAKYALVLFLSYIALQFITTIISGSQNGTNAINYLNQAVEKGYLPRAVNGQIPSKSESVVK